MKVTASEAKEIVYDDNPDWKKIAETHLESTRWSQVWEYIFRYKDDKTFRVVVFRPSTEQQDGQDIFNDEDPVEFCELKPIEKTGVVYEAV